MKGTAPADTLTGRIQREISDGWMPVFMLMRALDASSKQLPTVVACLERLVKEGRAEHQIFEGVHEYRGKIFLP